MQIKKSLIVSASLVAVLGFSGAVGAAAGPGGKVQSKRVIAHSQTEVRKALDGGCAVVRQVRSLTALRCPETTAQALSLQDDIQVMALENGDDSAYAQRGELSAQSASANQQIRANTVQAGGNIGTGRKIAVLDTGYNYTHPELASSYLGGWDFVNDDNNPMDDEGHGSHVSGIITADGVDPAAKGVASGAGIVAGKVLDATGNGYFSDVVAGIYWAVDGPDGIYGTADDWGVDAINLSLGTAAPYVYKGFCDSALPDLTAAIQYATQKNVMVVAAAGNSGSPGVSIPGCISYATSVGAVDSRDHVASFSGRGKALDITAPGVNIYSTLLGNSYASWSGTSMATPMVSGAVALVKYAHPAYTQPTTENKLFTTAKDLGKIGKDTDYGWGRVDAFKAAQ